MPVSELHQEIAAIALRAGARHGFALAGGNALLAHEFVDRETEDVDLFTNKESGVEAAAGAVEPALRRAGYVTERQDEPRGWPRSSREWAKVSPSGSSPHQMGARRCSRCPTSIASTSPCGCR